MKQLQFAQYYNQHMMEGNDWGWSFMMMLIPIVLIAAFFVFMLRSANNTSQKNSADPLDIAKARYAKGDITKAQFAEIKKDLKN